MNSIAFEAFDYGADQRFARVRYLFRGSTDGGWRIERDGAQVLELGPGYRALRVRQCGVCSTDLARHRLPFPLPQVIGHEVVAVDESGCRFVVEINASHEARGIAHDCAFCRAGLATHCPERVTLGINDLPGGFGPWILAPVAACIEVPSEVPDRTAVLVEPLAAALHAVATIEPRAGERIAVLGPRRLGMLVIAALAAVRERRAERDRFAIAAVVRDARLGELARTFGADDAHVIGGDEVGSLDEAFDVVVDTTGNPQALADAVRMAIREVHLKSTHGQQSCGLEHLTELVVDELTIAALASWSAGERQRIAWLSHAEPPAELQQRHDVQRGTAAALAVHYQAMGEGLPRADVAVVDSVAGLAAAIRPVAEREQSLVRPRGRILVHADADGSASPLLQAVLRRDLRLSSSRCGDFRAALDLLVADADLRRIGERLVTHRFAAVDLPEAFTVASSRACIKAVIEHESAEYVGTVPGQNPTLSPGPLP